MQISCSSKICYSFQKVLLPSSLCSDDDWCDVRNHNHSEVRVLPCLWPTLTRSQPLTLSGFVYSLCQRVVRRGLCVTNNVTRRRGCGDTGDRMRSSGAEAGVVPGNLKPASRFLMQKGLPGEGDNLTLLQSGVITRQRARERGHKSCHCDNHCNC